MTGETIHRVSGHVVSGLALFALALVVGATVLTLAGRFEPSPGGDEGTAAHLFQIAVVLIVPAGVAFLVTAGRSRPAALARRLAVPAVALAVAFALLYVLEHLR